MIGPQLEEGWVNTQQYNLIIMPKQSPLLHFIYIFNKEVKTPNLQVESIPPFFFYSTLHLKQPYLDWS